MRSIESMIPWPPKADRMLRLNSKHGVIDCLPVIRRDKLLYTYPGGRLYERQQIVEIANEHNWPFRELDYHPKQA